MTHLQDDSRDPDFEIDVTKRLEDLEAAQEHRIATLIMQKQALHNRNGELENRVKWLEEERAREEKLVLADERVKALTERIDCLNRQLREAVGWKVTVANTERDRLEMFEALEKIRELAIEQVGVVGEP